MGKNVVTQYIDDRTGEPVPEGEVITVILTRQTIRPDGDSKTDSWELVLAAPSERELAESLNPFTKTATPTGPHKLPTARNRKPTDPTTPIIREWWTNLGRAQLVRLGNIYNDGEPLPEAPVSGKGRVPNEVRAAYEGENKEAENVSEDN